MIILGSVFTVVNYICFCVSRFLKEKKYMILLDMLAKIFTMIGLLCFHSLTGVYNMILSLLALICLHIRERYYTDNKMTWLFIVFQAALCGIFCYTYIGMSSILVFITSSVTLFHTWFLKPQGMRLMGGLNCIPYMIYLLTIGNWVGFAEIIVMISNFTAFLKYKKQEEKDTPT